MAQSTSVSADGPFDLYNAVAGDHMIFADALRGYLEKTFALIGAVADGRVRLAAGTRLRPELIVTDFAMPILNGQDGAPKESGNK